MKDEIKKQGVKYTLASIPVGFLALIYQTMTELNQHVGDVNNSLATIALRVERNTSDIQYQRNKMDAGKTSLEKINASLAEIRAELRARPSYRKE